MTSVTEKFLSWVNDRIDAYGKLMSADQMILLRSAQAQVADADVPDYVKAKQTSANFMADRNGWTYKKIGGDLAEFLSDVVEFMLVVSLNYCVRCAEQRVRNLWKTLPLSWQTQPIYDVLYKFKERDDLNLRSNIEYAMRHCKINPCSFLELVLKNDNGILDRKKIEAADRAVMERQIADMEEKKYKEASDAAFEEIHAMPNYEEAKATCIAWYKGRYPSSFIDIDNMPQCVDSYLLNLIKRGGYENFDNRNDYDQGSGQTQNLDAALLDNE
jgi:hypothetical protein